MTGGVLFGLLAMMKKSMEPPEDVFKTREKSWYKLKSGSTQNDVTKDKTKKKKGNQSPVGKLSGEEELMNCVKPE